MQWPAGDAKEEDDIEEEKEEDDEYVVNKKKSTLSDLYGINYWNYDSIDN